eukprot:8250991-Pyramimonas_sp.AAC.1
MTSVQRRLRKHSKRRRAAPEWPLPADVWALLLVDRSGDQKKNGWPEYEPSMRFPGPLLGGAILTQLAAVRQHQRLNAWWYFSQTYQVSKMNNTPRTRGTRLLHGLCPFGEFWVSPRQILTTTPLGDTEHGYARARSRPEAIT